MRQLNEQYFDFSILVYDLLCHILEVIFRFVLPSNFIKIIFLRNVCLEGKQNFTVFHNFLNAQEKTYFLQNYYFVIALPM